MKKGRRENCHLFNEVWPRWGVCLYVCVLLCECVTDAANCPFAVYPMGSGMSLVTACSLSLNAPVAMAAPQRPAPPCQSTESDRPIRAGRCDMQSVVITALRKQEPCRGHRTPAWSQQDPSPNKHDEPGPWRSCMLWRGITRGTCHREQLAWQRMLHHPEGLGTDQMSSGQSSSVVLCRTSSASFKQHIRCFAAVLCKAPSSVENMLRQFSVWDTAGEWRNGSNLGDDELTIERESVTQSVASNLSASL